MEARDNVIGDDDLLRMVLERADPIAVTRAGCTCSRVKEIAMDDRVWMDRCRSRWNKLEKEGAWKLYRWLSEQEDERDGLREECSEAEMRHQQAARRAARFSSELAKAEQLSDSEMRATRLSAERAESKALAIAMQNLAQMEAAMDEKAVRLANKVEEELRSEASRRAAEMATQLALVECKMEAEGRRLGRQLAQLEKENERLKHHVQRLRQNDELRRHVAEASPSSVSVSPASTPSASPSASPAASLKASPTLSPAKRSATWWSVTLSDEVPEQHLPPLAKLSGGFRPTGHVAAPTGH